MQKGVLTPSNYDIESFDIITSFEVIEHINNPTEELNNFHVIEVEELYMLPLLILIQFYAIA